MSPSKARRFVAYYRVSTERQGSSGLGLEAQQKAVRDYLNGGAWELVGEFVELESNSPGPSRCSRVTFNAKTHDEIV
jgi:DNA invertase Pin-like site-specific DNA recombinase